MSKTRFKAVEVAVRYEVDMNPYEPVFLAVRDGSPTVTLARGQTLGTFTRPGAILASLLAVPGEGPFTLVAIREGGPPRKTETDAAERILAAGRLVDLPMVGVVLVRRNNLGKPKWIATQAEVVS